MGYYRNFSLGFWSDPKICSEFSPEDKYIYIYLITNSHTLITGVAEISLKQMELETGYKAESLVIVFDRLEQKNVIRWNRETNEFIVLNFHKYNWSTSSKLIASIKSSSLKIKDKAFAFYVLSMARKYESSIGLKRKIKFDSDISLLDTYNGQSFDELLNDNTPTDNSTTDNRYTDNRYTDNRYTVNSKQIIANTNTISNGMDRVSVGYKSEKNSKKVAKKFNNFDERQDFDANEVERIMLEPIP